MGYKESKFTDIEQYCKKTFGDIRGKYIYVEAEKRLAELTNEVDDRGSRAIKRHMLASMLPLIAYHLTLQKDGFSKEEAYNQSLNLAQSVAIKDAESYKKLGQMPFAYQIFKLACKKKMKQGFPEEGWEIEWIRYDQEEICFEMKRCIYHEIVSKYQCPELCTVFCANDVTVFGAMAPNIIFERTQTIGEGKNVCDFHFCNGKKRK